MTDRTRQHRAKRRHAFILAIIVLVMFAISLLLISNDFVRFPSEEVDANATLQQATINSLLQTNAPPAEGIAAADYEATLANIPEAQAVWLRQTASAQAPSP